MNVAMILQLPLAEVRDQTQMPCPLDQLGYLALIFCTQPRPYPVHDLSAGRDETSEQTEIVVMEELLRQSLGALPVDLAGRVEIAGHQIDERVVHGIVGTRSLDLDPGGGRQPRQIEVRVGLRRRRGIGPRRCPGDGNVFFADILNSMLFLNIFAEGLELRWRQRSGEVGFIITSASRIFRILRRCNVGSAPANHVEGHLLGTDPFGNIGLPTIAADTILSIVALVIPRSDEPILQQLGLVSLRHAEQSTLFVGELGLDLAGKLAGGGIPNQRGWLVRTKTTGSLVVVIDSKRVLTVTTLATTRGAEEAAMSGGDTTCVCCAGDVALARNSGGRRLHKQSSATRQSPTCYRGGHNT
mmetsp:Transcript_22410/g.64356  ORF Transcript_22410/g.64356 Transcript_22410/m.64356 type:complete len:356 (+) Transcript_22410:2257-3324(+)